MRWIGLPFSACQNIYHAASYQLQQHLFPHILPLSLVPDWCPMHVKVTPLKACLLTLIKF